MSITYKFSVGDTVEAHPGPHGGPWLRAIVERLEPYRGRPGYYVRYPYATNEWECHCGWQPERFLREVSP